ncbi:MAG TPA: hypothetical protein VFY91_06240 [Microbacterium sp.]|nr:hypothetical protein [Microbacterium sp.]
MPAEETDASATIDDAPAPTARATELFIEGDVSVMAAPPIGERKVFVCKYVGTPGDGEVLQTGQNPISVSVNAIFGNGPVVIGDFFEDAQGRSIVIAFDVGQPEPSVDDCPDVTPGIATGSVTVTPPSCEDLDGGAALVYSNATVTSATLGGVPQPAANFAAGFYDTLPEGDYVITLQAANGFEFEGGETTLVLEFTISVIDAEDCEVPIPVLFDADPIPATCLTAGALPDIAGMFPNVSLAFDRPFDGPGTYILTATALNGYEFPNGETVLQREITVDAALICPPAPEFMDPCGTENDGYTVPDDTEAYFYEILEEGDTVTVTVIAESEVGFPEGTETEWTFTFTDEPCPVVVPPAPPAPAGNPAPTTPLAMTGGQDMLPLGIGAFALILAGIAALGFRAVRSSRG